MKKNFKKILSAFLAFVMVVMIFPSSNAYAERSFKVGKITEFRYQEDGKNFLYKIQVSGDKLSFQLDKTNIDTGELTTIIYDKGIATTYITSSESFLGIKSTKQRQVNKIDYNRSIQLAEDTFTTQAYRSSVSCIIPTMAGNYLWYQMGITSPDVGYMLMGCDWSYRVKADACTDCKNFRDKIIECNTLFAGSGVSSAVAVTICAFIIAAAVPVTIPIVIAIFGIDTAAATALISAVGAEVSAHDSYDIAKGYGQRI
jgi:hypothetical protein